MKRLVDQKLDLSEGEAVPLLLIQQMLVATPVGQSALPCRPDLHPSRLTQIWPHLVTVHV